MGEEAERTQALETEDAVLLGTLSEDDLSHIASDPRYRTILRGFLTADGGENSTDTDSVGTQDDGRGIDPTRHGPEERAMAPDKRRL